MSEEIKKVVDRIFRYCRENKVSLKEVAKQSGVSFNDIYKMIESVGGMPAFLSADQLSKFLDSRKKIKGD